MKKVLRLLPSQDRILCTFLLLLALVGQEAWAGGKRKNNNKREVTCKSKKQEASLAEFGFDPDEYEKLPQEAQRRVLKEILEKMAQESKDRVRLLDKEIKEGKKALEKQRREEEERQRKINTTRTNANTTEVEPPITPTTTVKSSKKDLPALTDDQKTSRAGLEVRMKSLLFNREHKEKVFEEWSEEWRRRGWNESHLAGLKPTE